MVIPLLLVSQEGSMPSIHELTPVVAGDCLEHFLEEPATQLSFQSV